MKSRSTLEGDDGIRVLIETFIMYLHPIKLVYEVVADISSMNCAQTQYIHYSKRDDSSLYRRICRDAS